MRRLIVLAFMFAVTACNKSKLPLTTAEKIRGEWYLTMFRITNKDNTTFEQRRMPRPVFKFTGADTCAINGTSVQKFKLLGEEMVYITKEKLINTDSIYQDLYDLKLTGNDEMEWKSNNRNSDRPSVAEIIYFFERNKSVN